jgi:putative flippase GtrA
MEMTKDRVTTPRTLDNGRRASVGTAIMQFSNLEVTKFLLVSAGNTLVGLLSIYLLKWSGSTDISANIGGYCIGLIVSFALNKRFTFVHSGAVFTAAARFFLVFLGAYAANLCAILAFSRYYGINGYAAQALGIPPYAFVFYMGSRYFAFRQQSFAARG